jgi:type I restriction enzyme M protein
VQLRQHLIENNQLEAVISLPSGVFKPYAGVSTAIIIFARGGKTENVFFYDVQSDGFTLDDKRTQIGDGKGDLPDVLAKYRQWCSGAIELDNRASKAFEVPAAEICANGFDLSLNRYKEQSRQAVVHESPAALLEKLQRIEDAIALDLRDLKGMLK